MAQPNYISFASPELQAQQAALERQQQMADYLRQQSMTPLESTSVSNPNGGSIAVKTSPWAGLAKLGQAYFANQASGAADEKRLALAQAMKQGQVDEATNYMNLMKGVPGQDGTPIASADNPQGAIYTDEPGVPAADQEGYKTLGTPAIPQDKAKALAMALSSNNPTLNTIGSHQMTTDITNQGYADALNNYNKANPDSAAIAPATTLKVTPSSGLLPAQKPTAVAAQSQQYPIGNKPDETGGVTQPVPAAAPMSNIPTSFNNLSIAPSKYDAMFAAAADEYNINPQILKRLGITESSLNPSAMNAKDSNGGSFGIMQINGGHIDGKTLTKQNILDPATNINKGAAILRQYLDANGEDMGAAIARYKGATSPEGIAKVAPLAQFIIGQQAQPPSPQQAAAQTAPQETPTAAPEKAAPEPSAGGHTLSYWIGLSNTLGVNPTLAKNAEKMVTMIQNNENRKADKQFLQDSINARFTAGQQSKADVVAQKNAPYGDVSLTGKDYLASLPPDKKEVVQGMVNYSVDPKALSTRNDEREKLVGAAKRVDPNFSTASYGVRYGVMQDFTKGTISNNIVALDQGINHMGTLGTLAQQLKNGQLQPANFLANAAKSMLGDAAPSNVALAGQAVGEEMMRVFRQAGASEREASAWQSQFNAAVKSPAQMDGALQTAAKLLGGRVNAINNKWNNGMDVKTGYPNILSDEAKQVLTRYGVSIGTGVSSGNTASADADLINKYLKK